MSKENINNINDQIQCYIIICKCMVFLLLGEIDKFLMQSIESNGKVNTCSVNNMLIDWPNNSNKIDKNS